jgi:DNA-binding NarL/FixJ family response regulator
VGNAATAPAGDEDVRNLLDSEKAHYLALASSCNLSPRETDVFLLLAQGRSRTYIQSELYLAGGTVKTHTTRIYRKLGVQNRQELITLTQECKTNPPTPPR